MRAARTDNNQADIDMAAARSGCCIVRASYAPALGFDRLYIHQGQVYICEIKDGSKPPSRRQLTDNERKVRAEIEAAGGTYHVIECADDLLNLLGRL